MKLIYIYIFPIMHWLTKQVRLCGEATALTIVKETKTFFLHLWKFKTCVLNKRYKLATDLKEKKMGFSFLTCSNMKANSTLSLGTLSVSKKQYSLK